MAITAWKEKAERARVALAKLRESATDAVVHARYDGEAVLAATLAGGIRGAFESSGKTYAIPGPSGTKIAPELPLGLALLAIAFSSPKSEASRDLHAAGSGILAYSGGREAENYMRARGAQKAEEAQ